MIIEAGRTELSRYDNRAPIHIAVAPDYDTPATTLCGGKVVSPIRKGPAIDISCGSCLSRIDTLPVLLSDPESDLSDYREAAVS